MTDRKKILICFLLIAALLASVTGNLVYGSVHIPFLDVLQILTGSFDGNGAWEMIVLRNRLPQTVTALLAGAALAVCGLMLQTLFKNPLAGPSILGISDGAYLGVALVMLYLNSSNYITVISAAFAGAAIILGIIILLSKKVRSNVMLLIIGIMMGYLASSAVSILNFTASADKVHQFVMWGMGDFSNVSLEKLPFFAGFTFAGLLLSVTLVKPLNALLLGESYAANLGVNINRARVLILICAGILTAAVTAFCGPVSFIGLAVPHIARLMLGSSNHKSLVPVTILSGAVIALLCNMATIIPGSGQMLPLNAVTSFIGAPVIIYVIINRRNIHYFN